MHKAWICPRCQMVNAPWVPQCGCKPDPEEDKRRIEDALKRALERAVQEIPITPYEPPIIFPLNVKPLFIAKIEVKGEENEHSEDRSSVQTEEENKPLW